MNVPAHVYATKDMLKLVARDRSLMQLSNVTMLPGILGQAVVMPDVHEGYGFPIGAVAAIAYDGGVISPGGIGYDINCGVRLLRTNMNRGEIMPRLKEISKAMYDEVPSGVGKGGGVKLNIPELDKVLNKGVEWAVKEGYASKNDLLHIESNGCMKTAEAYSVSEKAKARGKDQLGTMGAGNHFVEINAVQQILDEEVAEAYGLYKGQIVIQIHTGSRGLGHQVATDYIREMMSQIDKFGYKLPDRELVCAPLDSDIGKRYLAAMSAAANFAWTNRQLITWEIRKAWEEVFGHTDGLELVYDVAHNIAKIEEHAIDGNKIKTIVHRKGATRAFPAGHPEVHEDYRAVGQPVLIPGSMGTASYVLAGKPGGMERSFGSSCHGAGRTMSRTKARKKIFGKDLYKELSGMGIQVQTKSLKGLAEEAPAAYKDVESVVDVVHEAGIAGKVARLKPLAVIKG